MATVHQIQAELPGQELIRLVDIEADRAAFSAGAASLGVALFLVQSIAKTNHFFKSRLQECNKSRVRRTASNSSRIAYSGAAPVEPPIF